MMLLTDEEISNYIDNMPDGETFDNWINDTPWKIVAKAQLKKVAKELKKGWNETESDSSSMRDFVNTFIQSLLKEGA